MEDVTLGDGRVMTDAEYIEKYGDGDKLSEFIPTIRDLDALARGLAAEFVECEFMSDCDDGFSQYRTDAGNRIARLLQFMPELTELVERELCRGRKKYAKIPREQDSLLLPLEEELSVKSSGTPLQSPKCGV